LPQGPSNLRQLFLHRFIRRFRLGRVHRKQTALIGVKLHRPAPALQVAPQHAQVLFRAVVPRETRVGLARGVIDHRHQVQPRPPPAPDPPRAGRLPPSPVAAALSPSDRSPPTAAPPPVASTASASPHAKSSADPHPSCLTSTPPVCSSGQFAGLEQQLSTLLE